VQKRKGKKKQSGGGSSTAENRAETATASGGGAASIHRTGPIHSTGPMDGSASGTAVNRTGVAVNSVLEFVALAPAARSAVIARASMVHSMGDSKVDSKEVAAFCELFPRAELRLVRAYVAGEEDENDIYPNDSTTVSDIV